MSGTPDLLGGRYEVGKGIGRGGMAEVHLGKDLRLGRTVAIKVLRADLARDPAFQARFRREAQSAASLNHPAIVAVYDTGEDVIDGVAVPFIVMEYVEGSTLRELLSSGKRLVPARAMEVTAAVLTALEYSHRQGIVHRDIKPGNVMLTRDGQVKVMDFGIARALADTGAMTQTAAVMGTAQYLSPEQARGEQVDARSDLYSTGCLLYELLTGRPPFTGDSPVSVAYQHVREEPQPPSSIDPEVPPAADAVTLKALRKDRDERYQTAADFREDLDRAVAGRPIGTAAHTSFVSTGGDRAGATTAIAPVGGAAAYSPPRYDDDRDHDAAPGTPWGVIALVMLAVFALAAIIGWFVLGDRSDNSGTGTGTTNTAQQATVPSVINQDADQAEALLEGQGFVVTTTRKEDDADEGTVIDQNPSPNQEVEVGSTIKLTVSDGPGSVEVPSLAGLTQDQAEQALEGKGLKSKVLRVNSSRQEGTVDSTSPSSGRSVKPGDTVTLRLASGKNEVPGVTNQTEEAASQELRNAGFTVEVQQQGEAGDNDVVLSQTPSGGTVSTLGTKIVITVGSTEVTDTSTPTPSGSSTPTGDDTPSPTPTKS